jgi:hypothetical protein
MNSRELKRVAWRGIVIENNGQALKLNDLNVHTLLGDVVEILGRMYVAGERRLDYVTANLGYGVPFIRECAERMRREDERSGTPPDQPSLSNREDR